MGFFTPSPTINYNFVAGVYGVFALLSIVFFFAQRFTDSLEGFYIVFAPFIPCFFWSLVVRQRWLQQTKSIAAETSTDDKETKKDK